MCLTLASGCSGVTLTFWSVWARTLGQSVLEILEEDDFFISGSLSKGNDVYARVGFGVHDGNRYTTEKAKRHESLFPICKAVIFEGKC